METQEEYIKDELFLSSRNTLELIHLEVCLYMGCLVEERHC